MAPTWMLRSDGDVKKMEFLDGFLQGAPYAIQKSPRVLVIGVGGGIDVLIALYNGAKHVVGAEVNSYTVRAIKEKWADFTGNIFNRPDVEIVASEGRHFLSGGKDSFDVIQLSGVDTWAAALAGGYVATETYLYTVEGVMAAMEHLTPNGVLSYSRFVLDPPGETLRLAGVMAEGLRRRGVANPGLHVVIVNGSLWADTLVKNTPFTREEVDALRTWAKANEFGILFDPFARNDERYELVLRGSPNLIERFYRESRFDLSPPTDDRPFFFNYEKWRNFVTELKDQRLFPAPSAILPMVCALGLTMLLATFGILIPMQRQRLAGMPGAWSSIVYFGSLGLGFIFVEIALIQKLMVFLGGPMYSLAFTLFVILFFSGLGSYLGRRWRALETLTTLAILIPTVIVVMNLVLSAAIPRLLGMALPLRIMIGILVISPVAFLIGMPFPLGLTIVGRLSPSWVPWAWAINAFTTVLGTLLAVLLSMHFGFQKVFLSAAFLYLVALLVMRRLAKRATAAGPDQVSGCPLRD
jgi:spermidine synthase